LLLMADSVVAHAEESPNASKKRHADEQLQKDSPAHANGQDNKEGHWKPASDEVLASRKIVKAKHILETSDKLKEESTSSVGEKTANTLETTVEETSSNADKSAESSDTEKSKQSNPFGNFTFPALSSFVSFGSLSSSSALPPLPSFTPPSWTASQSSSSSSSSTAPSSTSSPFGELPKLPLFEGFPSATIGTEKKPVADSADKAAVPTGEEHETHVEEARVKLYVLDKEAWKERGTGNLRLNFDPVRGKSRLVMRTDGVYRVALNVALWEAMTVEMPTDKTIRFAGFENDQLTSFLIRTQRKEVTESLFKSIQDYKKPRQPTTGTEATSTVTTTTAASTPENTPK
jgi:hypothetical protein